MAPYQFTSDKALWHCNEFYERLKQAIDRLSLNDLFDDNLDVLKNDLKYTPQTRIVLVGPTGSGKSSLINALLGLDLCPTSGMEAHTSTAVEISYHPYPNLEADIIFVTKEEWVSELTIVLGDLADNLPGDGSKIAWDKIKAVYPGLTRGRVSKMTVQELLAHNPEILLDLGKSRKVTKETADGLRSEIFKYAASTEVPEGTEPPSSKFWPLIKEIKLRCSAEVLSTGSVLVDLPGTHDTNAARSAVGEAHVQDCDRVWIVARAPRALSDLLADTLIATAMRRQIQMDGLYNAEFLTLIITQTDDLKPSEIINNLRLQNDPTVQALTKRIDALEGLGGVVNPQMILQDLRQTEGKKRRKTQHEACRKKVAFDRSSNLFQSIQFECDSSSEESDTPIQQDSRGQMTTDARDRLIKIATREMRAFCSQKRSEQLIVLVQQHFRDKLRELDESAASEADPINFDPDIILRDYDSIKLPVKYCSSREHARLTRGVRVDGSAECFLNTSETGIPQLRRYCHLLTASSHRKSTFRILKAIKALAQSIRTIINSVSDEAEKDQDEVRHTWESRLMRNVLPGETIVLASNAATGGIAVRLRKEFSEVIDRNVPRLKRCLKDGLEEKCRTGSALAARHACENTVRFLNVPEKLSWQTVRAIMRRGGSWHGRDLNLEIIDPLTRTLLRSWCKIFKSDLFSSFQQSFELRIEILLQEFMDSIPASLEVRARDRVDACRVIVGDGMDLILDDVQHAMDIVQKTASRSLIPHVQDKLRPGYHIVLQEQGPGAILRQRNRLLGIIDKHKDDVFTGATRVLFDELDKGVEIVREKLVESSARLAVKVQHTLALVWENPQIRGDRAQAFVDVQAIIKSVEQYVSMAAKWD